MTSKYEDMTIDEKIIGMTTIINTISHTNSYSQQGTGFYYMVLADEPTGPINEEQGLGWYEVKGEWLITNRHMVLRRVGQADGTEKETLPDNFTFNIRVAEKDGIKWVPINLNKEELVKRTKFHPDANVDVVAIDVKDKLQETYISCKDKNIIGTIQLTKKHMPGISPIPIEATTDVVVCSYPHGFYDKKNKFPIIKSGIVASSWGSNFDGKPYFLIDAKLFPGSSGGLVLSKPTDLAMINGKPMHSKEKQFSLLGIYSGEYYFTQKDEEGKERQEYYGLGIVWYYYLIPQIIEKGISLQTE